MFSECAERRRCEARLAALFEERGFSEVATPILEYNDLLSRTGSPLPEEATVKTILPNGRVCVLRPDNTAAIARLAATRLPNETLRLWYAQTVYRTGCELPQAGVEAIGVTDDVSILRLAIEAVELCYDNPVHIEVGHAGVMRAVLAALDLSEERRELLVSYILRKNFAALGDELPANSPVAHDLLTLIRLSGGADAIEQAGNTIQTPLDKPLNDLRKLLNGLPDGTVTVDFSLAPSIGYYTGVFFRGYVEGSPDAVLNGGRYDRLTGLLGREAPAIGFALSLV